MSGQLELAPEVAAPPTRFKVDNQDYINAVQGNAYRCAIVRAVQRQIPGATRVRASRYTIAWSVDEQRFVYPTPEVAIEHIIKPLDTGGLLEPVNLRLEGGYVKPVLHRSEEELMKQRSIQRRWAANRPDYHTSHTYGRFNNG